MIGLIIRRTDIFESILTSLRQHTPQDAFRADELLEYSSSLSK